MSQLALPNLSVFPQQRNDESQNLSALNSISAILTHGEGIPQFFLKQITDTLKETPFAFLQEF
jgi:hypothetical protein